MGMHWFLLITQINAAGVRHYWAVGRLYAFVGMKYDTHLGYILNICPKRDGKQLESSRYYF